MKYFLRSSLPSAEEGQLSVSGKRLRTILIIKPHRGLSLPSKSEVRQTDHALHDPNG